MRPDLRELEINESDLKSLTGINIDYIEEKIRGHKLLVISVSIGVLIFSLLNGIGNKSLSHFWWTFVLLAIGLSPFWLNSLIEIIINRKKLPKLRKEIAQYNQLIKNIHTLDQLEEIGHPVSLKNREKFISILKINRDNIIKILKTDRILKENPEFKPEQFNLDLTELQLLESNQKAIEYRNLLEYFLEINLSIQEEINKLKQKP